MKLMSATEIRWILFDLGNVLVDYKPTGLGKAAAFLGVGMEDFCGFLAGTKAANQTTTGQITPEDFTAMLSRRFHRPVTRQLVVSWFGPEIAQVYDGIPELVTSLATKYSLGILSNTFFGHWDYFITTDLAKLFKVMLPSHLIGYVKPDPMVYREALNRIRADPASVLFIDDREENVIAAKAVGINSFQSRAPGETIKGLQELGILPPCNGPVSHR